MNKDIYDFALEDQFDSELVNNSSYPADFSVVDVELSHFNKMWVTVSDMSTISGQESNFKPLILVNGKPKYMAVSRPVSGQSCFIDWLNLGFGIETGRENILKNINPENYEEVFTHFVELDVDLHVHSIFGFHIGKKNDKGRNFFAFSWNLVDQHGESVGLVLAGGQNGKILIMLSGTGCTLAADGWQQRLHDFLSKVASRATLSRVDVAIDFFNGEYSVDWVSEQDDNGGFYFGTGIEPTYEQKGAWKRPSGKGRTATIGSRQCDKYLRAYEKGKKEGDPSSLWTRFELEFKNKTTVISFDILINPTGYFVEAYPCFKDFDQFAEPCKFERIKKTAEINTDSALKTIKTQYGKYFAALQHVYSRDELFELVTHPDPDVVPKRLVMSFRYAKIGLEAEPKPIYPDSFQVVPKPTGRTPLFA